MSAVAVAAVAAQCLFPMDYRAKLAANTPRCSAATATAANTECDENSTATVTITGTPSCASQGGTLGGTFSGCSQTTNSCLFPIGYVLSQMGADSDFCGSVGVPAASSLSCDGGYVGTPVVNTTMLSSQSSACSTSTGVWNSAAFTGCSAACVIPTGYVLASGARTVACNSAVTGVTCASGYVSTSPSITTSCTAVGAACGASGCALPSPPPPPSTLPPPVPVWTPAMWPTLRYCSAQCLWNPTTVTDTLANGNKITVALSCQQVSSCPTARAEVAEQSVAVVGAWRQPFVISSMACTTPDCAQLCVASEWKDLMQLIQKSSCFTFDPTASCVCSSTVSGCYPLSNPCPSPPSGSKKGLLGLLALLALIPIFLLLLLLICCCLKRRKSTPRAHLATYEVPPAVGVGPAPCTAPPPIGCPTAPPPPSVHAAMGGPTPCPPAYP